MSQPTDEELNVIKGTGCHKVILSKAVGQFRLSVLYRQSSAMIESPGLWYPESCIWRGKEWLYQGEGWADFRTFEAMAGPEDVETFLKARDEG